MREEAARSTFWSVMELAGGQGLSFIVFLILARILRPEDYGVVTLAYVVVTIPSVILVQGFADALVQRPEINDAHVSTALWCNLAIAAAFVAATFALADAAAKLAGEPMLAPVLRALSPHFLFTAAVSVPSAIYRRRMHFRTFAIRTVAGGVVGGALGIAMAVTGWGVWALVANQLCQGAVSVVVIWWGFAWPGLRFSGRAFKDLYGFSAEVMLASFVGYAASQVDKLAIGLFLGAHALGSYYLAMRLFNMAGDLTHNRINEVSLPVLSRMQDDPGRFGSTYVSLVWMSTAAWFPLVAGLGLIGPLLVPTVFGPQWAEAAALTRVLAFMCFTCPLVHHTGRALLAVGRADVWRTLCLLQLIVSAVVYAAAARFGLLAVGAAFAALFLMAAPFHFVALRRFTGVRPWGVVRATLSVYAAGAIMVPVVLAALAAAPSIGIWAVPLCVCAGGAAYLVALWALCPARVAEVVDVAARIVPAWVPLPAGPRTREKAAE
jgi:O-antigen/teichoic acid export membrane protein